VTKAAVFFDNGAIARLEIRNLQRHDASCSAMLQKRKKPPPAWGPAAAKRSVQLNLF